MSEPYRHEKQRERTPKYVCGLKNCQSLTKLNVYCGKICGWTDAGSARDQTWFLQPVGSNDNGPYLITSNLTYKHIVAKGRHALVELSDGSPDIYEAQWNMVPMGYNFVFVNVRFSDCVLDLAAGLNHDGNDIYCWPFHGGANQVWTMINH